MRQSHLSVWLAVCVGLVALASPLLVGGARSATPSSGQIAFTRGNAIYVMRVDGSGIRVVRRVGWAWLAWSPDGSRLAFTASGGTWVMDADGSHRVRIGPGGGSRRTWSPDGRRIAFSGQPEGWSRDGVWTMNAQDGIWVMNADGRNLHRISTPRLDRMTFTGWGPFDIDWSPTGRLVFTAVEPGTRREGRCGIPIYVMNADGSNLRDVTPIKGCPSGEPHDANPDWSPDGRRIAYVRDHEMWVMNANGRSPVRLTDSAAMEVSPDWSPDGQRIVFERFGKTGSEIVVMNADGTHARRLTGGTGPRWRPVSAP